MTEELTYSQQWKIKNPDYHRLYVAKNREKINQYQKEYKEKNADAIKKYYKAYNKMYFQKIKENNLNKKIEHLKTSLTSQQLDGNNLCDNSN